jgi:hypothetical protein
LRKQKEQFFYQLSLLDGLRGGTPADRMFVAIDRALIDDTVWFQSWDFKRAGSSVKPTETQGTNTGYFIVVPKSNEAKPQQVWRIETHRGQVITRHCRSSSRICSGNRKSTT